MTDTISFQQLGQQLQGDVLVDELSRRLYANDASPYQKLPLAVVRPKNLEDCTKTIQFAIQHALSITARSAGTSLAGQAIGDGLIIDTGRYMNQVLQIDAKNHLACVEPGVVRQDLNTQALPFALQFGPDPSTSNYCTLGGMVGNNAWGVHSLRYGTTRDRILAVKLILSDASILEIKPLTRLQLQEKLTLQNSEGALYRAIYELLNDNTALIDSAYPSPDGLRRNSGYAMDVMINQQPWIENGPLFNLAGLICGAEGTLGLVTEITVQLDPVPEQTLLCCLAYDTLDAALRSVPGLLNFQPAALELLDDKILQSTANSPAQGVNRFWLQGQPRAVLLAEFQADFGSAYQSIESIIHRNEAFGSAQWVTTVTGKDIHKVWALRKAGLGSLMGYRGAVKPVTGVEDAALPVAKLADYVARVKDFLTSMNTDCVVYGPVGRGVLHLRPLMELNSEGGQRDYLLMMDQVNALVKDYGGTVSGKHGDGRLRAWYLEQFLGSEVIALMHQVKAAFDPQGLFNPHVIVNAAKPDVDLRPVITASGETFNSFFDWSDEGGLVAASQQCNGAGVCLSVSAKTGFCPSYQATREEQHGTRGRANVFRQLLVSESGDIDMSRSEVKAVLDLCLSCKTCKHECPARVDMAQLKAEFLQHYYLSHRRSIRSRLIIHFDRINQLAVMLPGLANLVISIPVIKRWMGFHPERQLPVYQATSLSSWWQKTQSLINEPVNTEVVLLIDPYSEVYQIEVAKAAISILQRLKVGFIVTDCLPLGRAQISQGDLGTARERLQRAVKKLLPYVNAGLPILSLEPSEWSVLMDEGEKLMAAQPKIRQQIREIKKTVFLFEQWLVQNKHRFKPHHFKVAENIRRYRLHGHCHQKALANMDCTMELLNIVPNAEVKLIESGCCGMAGAFGYEHEHFEVSRQIAELHLFPAIRKAEIGSVIVANGFSCRHQISEGLQQQALHPVQVIASMLLD